MRPSLNKWTIEAKSPLRVPPHYVEWKLTSATRQCSMRRRRDAEQNVESVLARVTPREPEFTAKLLGQETGSDQLVQRSKAYS